MEMLNLPNQKQYPNRKFPRKPRPQPSGIKQLLNLPQKAVFRGKQRQGLLLGGGELMAKHILKISQIFFAVCHGRSADFIFQETAKQIGITGIFCGNSVRVADMGGQAAGIGNDGSEAGGPPKKPAVMKLPSGIYL